MASNWKCLLGLHDMKVIRIKDTGKGIFTTGMYTVVQCTRCKEQFNG